MDIQKIKNNFEREFNIKGEMLFSCGGRFEILGNHTDHNHGLCLAATCNLCITAAVSKVDDNSVIFVSEGFPADHLDLSNLEIVSKETGKSAALIRGVAKYLSDHGFKVGGFRAYSESSIFRGAGVSSSAAFELLVGQIYNVLFNEGKIDKLTLAKAGQYAENVYYGKASGLLDQIGVSYGGVSYIDFGDIDNPKVEHVPFAFKDLHFLIINTGGDHSNLSHLYAEIPQDMYAAARSAGVNYLRDTSFESLNKEAIEERMIHRAIHFYSENERVLSAVEALKNQDQAQFLEAINGSRISSTNYLKNMMVEGKYEGSPLEACDLFMKITNGEGAIKINGGGFAGSVIAVIPAHLLNKVIKEMGEVYGQNNVKEVFIREEGPSLL